MFLGEGEGSWKPWSFRLEEGAGGGGGNAGGSGGAGSNGEAGGGTGGSPGPGGPGSGGDAGKGGDGGGSNAAAPAWHENAGWYDALPEGLKESASALEGMKGKPLGEVLSGLTKQLAEAAPPATAKDYKVQIPPRPDGSPGNPADYADLVEAAHKRGLNNASVQALMDIAADAAKSIDDAQQAAKEKAKEMIRKEWGDQYDQNVAFADRAIQNMPEDVRAFVTSHEIGDHPYFIRMVYRDGLAQQEGRLHQGDSGAAMASDAQVFYGTAAKK